MTNLIHLAASSFLVLILQSATIAAWALGNYKSTRPRPELQMGLWDGLTNMFEKRLTNDFVKLDRNDESDIFGPGPLLVLYQVPRGIEKEEIYDMIQDGAPQAFSKGVQLAHLDDAQQQSAKVMDLPMKEALECLVTQQPLMDESVATSSAFEYSPSVSTNNPRLEETTPVLFFCGFSNPEMLQVYNILGAEIYQESQLAAACAKAVPNAMAKPLRQVLEEICGDHKDAMKSATMTEEEAEDDSESG